MCHDILGQTALVDLAGLRDAIAEQGGDPALVNPVVPTQLIVDHSLAVEAAGFDKDAFRKNRAIEDRRNEDRFHFIEWTKTAFKNVDVIPPGNGIMHQINLEKMSPVIQARDGVAFPDTCVGTDSPHPARRFPRRDRHRRRRPGSRNRHAGPRLPGCACRTSSASKLTGKRQPGITATDIVLALTEFLRKEKVVGAWLEFFGEGADSLTLGDRATISNMCPEYGATAAMFYIDAADHHLPETDRPRSRAGRARGELRQDHRSVGGQHECRRIRACAGIRSVPRGAQHGRPVQSAPPSADVRPAERGIAAKQAGSGQGRRSARPDAGWRRHHRRHHHLHQHHPTRAT